MNITSFTKISVDELKDRLGWWEHGESADFSQLVSAVMILCQKVLDQEKEIKRLEDACGFE